MTLERALQIEGHTTVAELTLLQSFALAFKDGANVADVGTWKGRSAVAFAEAGATVTAIDAFSGIEETLGSFDQSILDEFTRNTAGLPITAVVGESGSAADQFRMHQFDIVFIDADHSYKAVIRDIYSWALKVRPGGVLCGHDFTNFPGVRRAVSEAFGDNVARWESVWFSTQAPSMHYKRAAKNRLARRLGRA